MSFAAPMPEPSKEPQEKHLRVKVASFKMIFELPGGVSDERLTETDLNRFLQSLLKPAFVRSQQEIKTLHGENLEVSRIEVSKGSIVVEAAIEALFEVLNNGIVTGTLGGVMTFIVTNRFFSASEKAQHQMLMKRIRAILKKHARNLNRGDFDIGGETYEIYDPRLKNYALKDFEFHSVNLGRLRREVDSVIREYHQRIGK